MANRKRDKDIHLRMSEYELERFDAKYIQSTAKSRTDFVLKLLDKKPIIVYNELPQMLAELKREGVLLNQIARHANQTGGILTDNLNVTIGNVNAVYHKLYNLWSDSQ